MFLLCLVFVLHFFMHYILISQGESLQYFEIKKENQKNDIDEIIINFSSLMSFKMDYCETVMQINNNNNQN